MTDRQFQQEEIDRDEQWLAGVCERSAEIEVARIKRVVRIAVEEQWLAGHVPLDTPSGLPARARRVVQEALSDAPGGTGIRGRTRVIRSWAWVGTGLAAAAAIAFAVVGSWSMAPQSEEAEVSFASAFEDFQIDEELDQELSRLRDAFSKLDQSVAQGWGEDLWEESADETSEQSEDGA